jgi:hypothetical protein
VEDACPQCGAPSSGVPDACRRRFEELLALDHSRREPWGSRHGLVFAAYAIQHPADFPRAVLERSWLALFRVYVRGDDPSRVFAALRSRPPGAAPDWDVPPLPAAPAGGNHFERTIADLAPSDVAGYASRVDSWCRSALRTWGAVVPEG